MNIVGAYTRPRTPLLGAPSTGKDPFGTAMTALDLIRGLKQANPKISVPLPDHYRTIGWSYPGEKSGQTCVWLGEPSQPGSTKIAAFHLSGAIPEHTQIAPNGHIIARGWRAILEKVIKSGAASRRRLERIFKVNLGYDDDVRASGYCPRCLKGGTFRRSEGGQQGLCWSHEIVYQNARQARAAKETARCLLSRYRETLHRAVSPVVPRFG